MAEIVNKSQNKDNAMTSTNLPHDIIEIILSKLPVKSLLRFKSVSKSWQTLITHSRFAATHLQQSKISQTHHLLVCNADNDTEAYVFRLENNEFQIDSLIDAPPENGLVMSAFCHCDGLKLMPRGNEIILWNPSSRTRKSFCYPYPMACPSDTIFGLCYDQSVEDYKVVIISDTKYYAVFHCKSNYWTEKREVNDFSCNDVTELRKCKGASFNGSFYWVRTIEVILGDGPRFGCEIVCFEPRDEKFSKLAKPAECGHEYLCFFHLSSLRGHLCMFRIEVLSNEITMFKMVGGKDLWTQEFKVRLPVPLCLFAIPVCWVNESEIIFEIEFLKDFLVYNQSTKAFAEIQRGTRTRKYTYPFPYLENLFFTTPSK